MQVEKRVLPHPALRGIVRSFGERRGFLKSPGVNWPLPPRPHQIIDINLKVPFRVRLDGGPLGTSPETVVVGPQGSRRIQLYASGEIHLFNILFQPAGLNRLTGIDMSDLVNEGIPAGRRRRRRRDCRQRRCRSAARVPASRSGCRSWGSFSTTEPRSPLPASWKGSSAALSRRLRLHELRPAHAARSTASAS
jgi:hypothetical protein